MGESFFESVLRSLKKYTPFMGKFIYKFEHQFRIFHNHENSYSFIMNRNTAVIVVFGFMANYFQCKKQQNKNYITMSEEKNIPQVKNEKQYEALVNKGYSKEKAARIANTPNSGVKGGKSKKYEEWTKEELYKQAAKVDIAGRSKMNKNELISALRNN